MSLHIFVAGMTKFYVNNLSLQDGDLRTISGAVSTGDSKKTIAPPWVPQSTNSTDILIKSLKPRLYPQVCKENQHQCFTPLWAFSSAVQQHIIHYSIPVMIGSSSFFNNCTLVG